ncbi:MAG: alpha/beta hydrolase, partial [Clostridia bacterium]|nr:alpha/beta hydrolase [Clostridia bacterium]
DLNGAIIMGTGFQPSVATGAGKAFCKLIAAFKGWHHRSKFINNLAFGSYLKKIEKPRTEFDWLSVNTENVDKYIADPLCGVLFTCSGFYGLFSIVADSCSAKTITSVNKDMPVYLVAGSEDPVGNYGKAVETLYKKYEQCGMQNVSATLYNGARHEILNEDCAPQVMDDIKDFIFENIGEQE